MYVCMYVYKITLINTYQVLFLSSSSGFQCSFRILYLLK